jgi:hypothetical protein
VDLEAGTVAVVGSAWWRSSMPLRAVGLSLFRRTSPAHLQQPVMRTAATAETGLPPSRAAKQARLLSLAGLRGPQDGIPALASVSDATLDRWLAWMERYEKACGCESGAALGLLTLIFWPLVGLRRLWRRWCRGVTIVMGRGRGDSVVPCWSISAAAGQAWHGSEGEPR